MNNLWIKSNCVGCGSDVDEQLRVPNSNSGVSDEQSVNPSRDHGDTCGLKQDTYTIVFSFGWGVKALVPCVV